MKKNNLIYNVIALVGLVALITLCYWFQILIAMSLLSVILGVYLSFSIEDFFRQNHQEDLTREEINQARKTNYL